MRTQASTLVPFDDLNVYKLAKIDADQTYLKLPSAADYKLMSHDTLVELILHRDLTIRALRANRSDVRRRSVDLVATEPDSNPNSGCLIERSGKRVKSGFAHLTPRGPQVT